MVLVVLLVVVLVNVDVVVLDSGFGAFLIVDGAYAAFTATEDVEATGDRLWMELGDREVGIVLGIPALAKLKIIVKITTVFWPTIVEQFTKARF